MSQSNVRRRAMPQRMRPHRDVPAVDLAQEPLEVIVADGMSDDGTREILDRLTRTDAGCASWTIRNESRRWYECRYPRGPRQVIAIMGTHQRTRRTICVQHRSAGANRCGQCRRRMFCEADTWLQGAIAAAHHSPFSVGGARWHNPNYEGPADTVFGGVYRREVFARIGLFDEQLARNQDDELNFRLIRAGGRSGSRRRFEVGTGRVVHSWHVSGNTGSNGY